METLFVAIDVLEREIRMLGVEKRQSQLAIAAAFVDKILPGFESSLVLGNFGFSHVDHPEHSPDSRFQSPARVVWPEDRAVAFVLVTVEQVRWITHDPIVGVQE